MCYCKICFLKKLSANLTGMDYHRSNQQLPMNSGLTRYRSAPSSYFSSFLDAADEAIKNHGSGGGGDDMDIFLNKFMPSNSIRSTQGHGSSSNHSFSSNMNLQSQSQFVASMKQERDAVQEDQNIYPPVSSMMHQSQAPVPAQVLVPAQQQSQMNAVSASPMKLGIGGDNSNLIRYNSSPAGFFASLDMEHEYGALGGMANFGAGNSANAEASYPSASRYHSGLMPPISEIGTSGMGETSPAGFPIGSWDDSSAVLSDSFLKGLGDDRDDNKALSNIGEAPSMPPTRLSHHLSLPKTSDELSAMETLLQDSVLCKLRAKRGCATHPRSIAERVRRTRISERMRKLQELVPNMDKQTNTSDMLDLAVDYIKDLKKQLQGLTDNRAKCTCLNH